MSSAVYPVNAAIPVDADPDDDALMTGEAVALDLRPASFVLRGAGLAIDWLLYFGSYLLVSLLLLPAIFGLIGGDVAAISAIALSLLVVFIVVIPTVVELLSHGKSLGKLAVGSRIVRDDGGAIGFRHALVRSLVAVLEVYMTFGGLAAIVALLNGRSKRLGDLLAGTYSQYERAPKHVPPVFGVPTELQQWAVTADVARMPDPLSRRIAQFLREAPNQTPGTRERMSRELAAEASVWVSPIPRVNAELFLAAVASIRRDREFAALELEKRTLKTVEGALGDLPHAFPNR